MGHPPRAVVLPLPGFGALAPAVERIDAWWGAPPFELAALLRGEGDGRGDQLAAVAWVLDPLATHVLLVDHRTYGWACPGGHVEIGETVPDAASRELTEETGLRLAPVLPDPVTLTLADSGDHRHWILGYRFEAEPGQPLTIERDPVVWHRLDHLPEPRVPDLDALLAALTGHPALPHSTQ